jgi:hypothetical protein
MKMMSMIKLCRHHELKILTKGIALTASQLKKVASVVTMNRTSPKNQMLMSSTRNKILMSKFYMIKFSKKETTT